VTWTLLKDSRGVTDSRLMGLRTSRLVAFGVVTALLTTGCGLRGEEANPLQGTPDVTGPITTTTVLQGARPTAVAPTLKPTTTAAPLPKPKGFPPTFPIPEGAATGYYTGNAHLGFHLNVATPMSTEDLVDFFTHELPAAGWALQATDQGFGLMAGGENRWANFSTDGQVITFVSGLYVGAVRIDGNHVDVLLDPEVQPIDGDEPELLPPPPSLPRPEPAGGSANYSRGRVFMGFTGEVHGFDEVVEAYRSLSWEELSFQDNGGIRTAVGDIAGWRVTIRGIPDIAGFFMEFENLELSYP